MSRKLCATSDTDSPGAAVTGPDENTTLRTVGLAEIPENQKIAAPNESAFDFLSFFFSLLHPALLRVFGYKNKTT